MFIRQFEYLVAVAEERATIGAGCRRQQPRGRERAAGSISRDGFVVREVAV